jgi:hypothetical protein
MAFRLLAIVITPSSSFDAIESHQSRGGQVREARSRQQKGQKTKA